MTNLETMSREQLIDHIAGLKAAAQRKITCKVTEQKADGKGTSGAVSVYGLGRFPVTLYASQWERLASDMPAVLQFIKDNAAIVARKD